jgi:hypothetical protein
VFFICKADRLRVTIFLKKSQKNIFLEQGEEFMKSLVRAGAGVKIITN